jgi:hypothetical protein
MSPMAIGWIVFACVFGGALIGMLLRTILPEYNLSAESKDVVKLGMGLVATMAALVLGLLIAQAQGSYSTQRSELIQMSANVILLDHVLAGYGPETKEARDLLRRAVVRALNQIWHENGSQPVQSAPTVAKGQAIIDKIQSLLPQNDARRSIQAQALSLAINLTQTRWLMFEQMGSSIPMPFLVMLVFWVTIIFVSFGVFAPTNTTVIATLFVCSLAVSGAIFLILEMDRPFQGLIQISSAPLRDALAHLGE